LRVGHTPAATNDEVQKNITEIHNKIKSGESTFEKMAYSYSEDYNSKYQGGEMDFINVTQFVGDPQRQAWVDKGFELPHDSAVSEPFRTSLGWHILMRVKIRPIGSFDQMRNV
jgi:peptidyl-prolyl cis-trans isomerase SurA